MRELSSWIVASSIALAIALATTRAWIIGWSPLRWLAGCWQDMLVLGAFGLPFWALSRRCRRAWAVRTIGAVWAVCISSLLLAALTNIEVVSMLGRSFNYRWLYYSDFLRSFDARQSLRAMLTPQVIGGAALAVVALFAVALLVRRWFPFQPVAGRMRIASGVALLAYVVWAPWYLRASGCSTGLVDNPAVAFVASLWETGPQLPNPTTRGDSGDFLTVAERPPDRAGTLGSHGIRNVLVFVAESVPARYLDAYSGKFGVSRELMRHRRGWRRYLNVYAHAPATNTGLITLLCGVYPWLDYKSLTEEAPDARVTAVSEVLAGRDYRCGLFCSADLRFQSADRFLAGRGFDVIADQGTIPSDGRKFIGSLGGWKNLDSLGDELTAKALLQWIGNGDARPFFAMIWTNETHHPYFVTGPPKDFGTGNPDFDRYLSALEHGDQVLGSILDTLRDRNLDASTLVVVMGDHGEAFGQHGQFGHASHVYEENIHIPLLLINPTVFRGEDDDRIGGILDVAPTILDVLRVPMPGGWQGRSLLAGEPRSRVYFFAPWSDHLMGFRDGPLKFIRNATTGGYEMFDLAADPGESRNLIDRHPEMRAIIEDRLGAWMQYQERFFAHAMAK